MIMKRPPRFFLEMLVCLLVTSMVSIPAYGHKIMVFAYPEGGSIYLEGYFADGKQAQDSLVEVFGEDGVKLLEGKTDDKGLYSFPMPDVPEMKIVLSGSMGHRAECVVKGGSDDAGHERSKDALPGAFEGALQQDENAGKAAVEEERIRAIVCEELDRKLVPLIREMAQLSRKGASLTDVIGGIGYIAGIMGLVLYFKTRRGSDT